MQPAAIQVRARTSPSSTMIVVLIALGPCIAAGLWATGTQAAQGLERVGLDTLPGWRGALLGGLGVQEPGAGLLGRLLLGALYLVPALLTALGTLHIWELLFARVRRRPAGAGAVVTAVVLTLLLPPGAPLYQVALGASFGAVFGKLIFGGTGRNFLNPALTGLAFLYFGYPTEMVGDPMWPGLAGYSGTSAFGLAASGGLAALEQAGINWWDAFLGAVPGTMGETSAVACLLGAALLLYRRVAAGAVMLGVAIGAGATGLAFNLAGAGANPAFEVPWHWHLVLGGCAFGAVFAATDPVSAPATQTARWIYGLLIGATMVLIRIANPAHPDGMLLAVLLGNIAAPLLDHAVVAANVRRRRRRREARREARSEVRPEMQPGARDV